MREAGVGVASAAGGRAAAAAAATGRGAGPGTAFDDAGLAAGLAAGAAGAGPRFGSAPGRDGDIYPPKSRLGRAESAALGAIQEAAVSSILRLQPTVGATSGSGPVKH
jgi:hypothetical protein